CDPRVAVAVLDQTEPHSDFAQSDEPWPPLTSRRGLIAMPTGPRKRVNEPPQKTLGPMKILSFSGVASPETLAYLTAPRRDALRRREHRSAGEWCNGNTTVFGTVILGSSPSSPATVL